MLSLTAFPIFGTQPGKTLANWSSKLENLMSTLVAKFKAEEWTEWQPVITCSGAMTWTEEYKICRYFKVNKTVFFSVRAQGTTGGVASTDIIVPLPLQSKAQQVSLYSGSAICTDVTARAGFWFIVASTGNIELVVRRYDSANWGLGASRSIMISGFYEVD